MGLFLFRFWPVLIPLLVYLLWYWNTGRKAVKAGKEKPKFRDGPWFWIVLSSLAIGFGCFIFLGATIEGTKGNYEPPHMENGVLVPGKIKP